MIKTNICSGWCEFPPSLHAVAPGTAPSKHATTIQHGYRATLERLDLRGTTPPQEMAKCLACFMPTLPARSALLLLYCFHSHYCYDSAVTTMHADVLPGDVLCSAVRGAGQKAPPTAVPLGPEACRVTTCIFTLVL